MGLAASGRQPASHDGGEGFGGRSLPRRPIELLHQRGRGAVVDLPQRRQHVAAACGEKRTRQADQFFACRQIGQLAGAKRRVAGTQRDQAGAKRQSQDLEHLQSAIFVARRLEIHAGKERVHAVEEAVGRQVDDAILADLALEPGLGRVGAHEHFTTLSGKQVAERLHFATREGQSRAFRRHRQQALHAPTGAGRSAQVPSRQAAPPGPRPATSKRSPWSVSRRSTANGR